MDIRPIRDGDEEGIVALWGACDLIRPWNDPTADIALARRSPAAEIFVGMDGDDVVATAMCGFDGHRGWLYYVATHPDVRGTGAGRRILATAEAWLAEQGCPKVELIIRGSNKPVAAFYEALGYSIEDRVLMAKWLVEPPVAQTETPVAVTPVDPTVELLDVTITFLEMTSRPTAPPRPMPVTGAPLSLVRLHNPTVSYYRYIQHTVGDPWLWYDRRKMSDEQIAAIILDDAVEIYVLSEGGVPAGFVELDFRDMPEEADIAYFGLMPDFIGKGLGPYLLDWAIRTAWDRDPAPRRLTVNTCTLDHPSALGGYQKAGFTPYAREQNKVPDPRALGIIPG